MRTKKRGGNKQQDAHVGQFVRNACRDSGQCIVFGAQYQRIFRFFDSFDLRSGLVQSIDAFGEAAESVNGIVRQIGFMRNGYEAFALAKCGKFRHSDNLMYEYAAGLFLNAYCAVLPCFVQTYGIYQFTPGNRDLFARNTLRPESFPDAFVPYTNHWDLSQQCDHAENNVLVTHFLRGSITFDKLLLNAPPRVVEMNVFAILFQVYYGLNALRQHFTHFDLHCKNVLLYELPGPVSFQYRVEGGGIVEFKCAYLAKMIDYGRTYFDGPEMNSQTFQDAVRAANCAHRVGFTAVRSTINRSEGLRLMVAVLARFKQRKILFDEHAFYKPKMRYAANTQIVRCPDQICTVAHLMKHFCERSRISIAPHDHLFGPVFGNLFVDGREPVEFTRGNEPVRVSPRRSQRRSSEGSKRSSFTATTETATKVDSETVLNSPEK